MDHKKYHLIQTQIEAARNALQQWNDRRAEAMIELDSIFTEVELYKTQMTEAQSLADNTIGELRGKLAKSEKDFHKHFEAYTNEMQELKLTNDELTAKLKEANNEIENQKQAQKKMEAKYLTKIAQVASETEVRVADQQFQLKTQITNLVAELQTTLTEKNTLAKKSDQYEVELRAIRTQMMSFLHGTKDVVGVEVRGTDVGGNTRNEVRNDHKSEIRNAEIASRAVTADADLNASHGAGATSAAAKPVKKLKVTEADAEAYLGANPPPITLNDYLKKFGY
jgi:hypothetical protein